MLLLLPALIAACGGGDAGLTRAEVEEIVRAEMAAAPPPAAPAAAMSPADVQGVVNDAIAAMPQPEPG